MARYIDADELKADHFVPSSTTNTTNYLYVSLSQIENAPTADVRENVHAHWEAEWHIVFHVYLPRCSSCGFYSPLRYNFCPNCGAQMEVDYDIR